MATTTKFIPGSEATSEEIFTYPFFIHEETKEFIKNHGKIMFIIRGPPGTGKWSLTQLMMSHYSTAVKCSADDYFTNTFNSRVRNKESLAQSHLYCHDRVRHECSKTSHPVIVSNTHVRKREMQVYLSLAEEYEYTVIICSTLDKFEVSAEILAKSNTKGLKKEYFEKRLKAWEDVFPMFMGWFLCPDDCLYVLHELQCALEALLDDGKFCRVFNTFDTSTLLNNFKAKTLLCCVAGFMKRNVFELEEYYKSVEVRDSYGKCFTICLQAFVVTKSNMFAVVQLDDDLRNLTFKSSFENVSHAEEEEDTKDIINAMQNVSLVSPYNFKLTPLKNEFSKKPKTIVLKKRASDYLDLKNSSFIHIAQREEKPVYELNELYRKSFMGVTEELSADQFTAVGDERKIYRLENDGWMIQIPKILSVKAVFTGLYI